MDRGLFVTLDGALTAASARRLADVVEDLFAEDPPPLMVAFDVAGLLLLDEDGLAVVARAAALADAAGTSFVLREPRRHVERLLRMAGLGDRIRSDPSVRPLPQDEPRPAGRRRTSA